MARVKITEHKAKTILHNQLQLPYSGVSITHENDLDKISSLSSEKLYVVKVDQGVKKRMKRGLVELRITKEELRNAISRLQQKGFSRFIIEEFLPHESNTEKFISMEREREGIILHYSLQGGIDIEENAEDVKTVVLTEANIELISQELGISANILKTLTKMFEDYYVSFLEINPLVVLPDGIHFLDMAVEVDSTASFFVKNAWTDSDIVSGEEKEKTKEEKAIKELSANSQAAFSLELLNPNGSIFVLLSGGGASLVLADEAYNLGYGKELANYGEYSGNPNAEETYLYTRELLSLLLKSTAQKKILIVGGGVANFTDVRITFKGVLKALEESKEQLKQQSIKIFVRRGGPNQEEGLSMMKSFLEKEGLFGFVSGPDIPLNEIVKKGIHEITNYK
jgi:ATP-citrate lyase beta-subunit